MIVNLYKGPHDGAYLEIKNYDVDPETGDATRPNQIQITVTSVYSKRMEVIEASTYKYFMEQTYICTNESVTVPKEDA